ncbi:MAG: glucosaminidase domain-containing protein [Mangrovibacterium sp.]
MKNIRLLLLFSFLFFADMSFAQRIYSRQDYINKYASAAVSEMHRSGVPASITLAQGCLESGNGNSSLSLKSNNHFGIKCHGWTGKSIRYDDDRPNECFRVYDKVEDSYADHSNFLSNNPRYSSLFQLDADDYKGWAHGLKKAGYATDPQYAHKLIKIIEEFELHQYDKMSPKDFKRAASSATSNPSPISANAASVFEVNGCRAVRVQPGDSPASIAQAQGVKLWEIYDYNDLPDDYRICEGEIIYLQKKKKRAASGNEVHVVQAGESLRSISQTYGIRFKSLVKLNRLGNNPRIYVGQKLNLRKRVKK